MISAVIPTYRGRDRLARNLGSVAGSLAASGRPWEIIVVDDGGGGVGDLGHGSRLLVREVNGGYGPAVNDGAREAAGDTLLVLNDDVTLGVETVGILERALAPGVFAVVPRIESPLARSGDEGGKSGEPRDGLIEIVEATSPRTHATLYPVGCCFLCRRDVFLSLGGFDESFAPFFWEDVDLGYRAWRAGLATRHLPAASCLHAGSATIGERAMGERLEAWFRGWALFHLRNVRDADLWAASLGAWAAYALFDDRAEVVAGLTEAFERFSRAGRRVQSGDSDREILARVARS